MKKFFILLAFSFLFFFVLPVRAEAAVLECSISPAKGTTKIYSSSTTDTVDYYPNDAVPFTILPTTVNWQTRTSNFQVLLCTSQLIGSNCRQATNTSVTAQGIQANFRASDINSGTFRAVLRGTRTGSTAVEDLCEITDAFIMVDATNQFIAPTCSTFSISPNPMTFEDTEITVSYDRNELKDSNQYYIRTLDEGGNGFQFSKKFNKVNDNLEDTMGYSGGTTFFEGSVVKFRASFDPSKSKFVGLYYGDSLTSACRIPIYYDPVTGQTATGSAGSQPPFHLCEQVSSPASKELCRSCLTTEKGIWTAFGCIPYGEDGNATGIIQAFIRIGLSIGGGVVVLMILGSGFMLSTSQGDPKRVEEAKTMVTSAVMGLVFIIFSITLLRFIGVKILQIPGFGS